MEQPDDVVDKNGAGTELKPCPFCGSTEIRIDEIKLREEPNHWQVRCLECGCGTLRYSYYALPSKDGAIKKWNRRVFSH